MRSLLFTLMSLACSALLAATVYKWIDENGVVHYSDQPHANAEKVHVAAPQTYKGSQIDGGGTAPAPGAAQDAASPQSAYRSCAIGQPAEGQDYPNLESLNIIVRTDPGLRPGDQIFIRVDGSLVNGASPTGTSYILSPVERGTHTVQAEVRDASGAAVCQTASVTFSAHQPSLQNPVNPIRPH